jgi:hypothetical protein
MEIILFLFSFTLLKYSHKLTRSCQNNKPLERIGNMEIGTEKAMPIVAALTLTGF